MKLNRFAAFAWTVAAYNVAVILWGAYVRASLSGDGCGSSWPLCNGQTLPVGAGAKTLVEFAHRATSGIALLLVVLLCAWTFRVFRKGHVVRRAATLSLVFILIEALIGAVLVRYQFVAGNPSASRAVWMAIHLVNTFALLASLTLTAWWAAGASPVRLRGQGRVGLVFAAAIAGMLLLAVSGAVAALGDTLYPARTLAEGLRQDFSPATGALVRLRLLHPTLAAGVGILLLFAASYASAARTGLWVKRWALALSSLVIIQIVVGLVNVALLAPVWLQLTHLLLADLMWVSLILLAASALSRESAEVISVAPAGIPSAAEL